MRIKAPVPRSRDVYVMRLFPIALVIVVSCSSSLAQHAVTPAPAPATPWQQYTSPEDAGYSAERLEVARKYADSVQSGAVMIIEDGSVVAAWGDVNRKLELHSVRKSIVSALFGMAADRRQLSLYRTLGDIGITDVSPLTPTERAARIRDLLAARSGVYLPAAYADASQDAERPARGSHAPDTFWFYNNWDFNTLGTIYERLVDSSLYVSLYERLAKPIGMEDYTPADGFLIYEPSNSTQPAHAIRMSTRDLARFGQLYLQDGNWNGTQVISRDWIAESTTSQSATGVPDRGYAYLWWTQAAGTPGRYPEVDKRKLFYASGTGGQLVMVSPADDLVIVHRGDTDHGRNISGRDAWRIVELVLEARTGARSASSPRTPLTPVAFASQLPAIPLAKYVNVDAALIAELSGRYEIAPNVYVRVFAFSGRLFGNFPGQGEAELFGITRSEFTIRVQSGVRIVFERDAAGRVTGMDAQVGSTLVHGTRR